MDNGHSADTRQMSSLLRVLFVVLTVVLVAPIGAADSAPPAAKPTPASLVGLTRDEVVALRGKPSGERARADGSVVMVYPDGAKIELRQGRVASVAGINGAEIVGADGTRYVPGADGNIQRPVQISDPAAAAVDGPTPETTASEAAPAAAVDVAEEELPSGAKAAPSVDAARETAMADSDEVSDDFEDEEEPEMSGAAKVVSFLIEAGLRFGLVVLVLRIAIHVVGVPFLWPDLLKVALLYLAVHEVMGALGALGGLWEFIPIFRLDSIVGFIVLACSLTWFKIAGSGLTALKLAVATGLVMYFLMLGIGVAIAIVVPSLLG